MYVHFVLGNNLTLFALPTSHPPTLSNLKIISNCSYKPERFYWESIIVSRKICVVALSVFGKELGPERQSQVVLLLLLVCIVLEIAGEPFEEVTKAHVVLKRLELSALLVEWGTFWCGLMIYQSGPKSEGMNSFMTLFVVTMNAILLLGFVIVLLTAYAEEKKLQKSSFWQKMQKVKVLSRKSLRSMTANSEDVQLPSDRSQVNVRQRTFDSEANSSVSNPCMMMASAQAAEVEMTSIGEPSKRPFTRHEADDGSEFFVEVATDESVWDLPEDGEVVEDEET